MIATAPNSTRLRLLAELGFATYDEYLDSSMWAEARLNWQLAGMPEQCLICARGDYNLHHRSYTLLGAEPPGHLVALCEDHHYEVHRLLKRRHPGINLWNAHLVYRKQYHLRRGGRPRHFSEIEFLGGGTPILGCELTEPDSAALALAAADPRGS